MYRQAWNILAVIYIANEHFRELCGLQGSAWAQVSCNASNMSVQFLYKMRN
jgi:hypothetical protein